jgi:hypothetical protein
MTNNNGIRHCSWTLLFFILTTVAIHFACSDKSETSEAKSTPAAELKAKLVYYAMPG